MKDTNKVAVPLIVDKDGKYLLITRSEYPEHRGEWGPIAGHVQEGEEVEQALVREANEELSIKIKPVKQVAEIDQDIPGDIGFWWLCEIVEGNIKPNDEIEEYRFFSSEQVKNLKLWPATRKFFENYIWK